MKMLIVSTVITLAVCGAQAAAAEDVTLVAPGGMRCPLDKMKPGFETKTGNTLKATIGRWLARPGGE